MLPADCLRLTVSGRDVDAAAILKAVVASEEIEPKVMRYVKRLL